VLLTKIEFQGTLIEKSATSQYSFNCSVLIYNNYVLYDNGNYLGTTEPFVAVCGVEVSTQTPAHALHE